MLASLGTKLHGRPLGNHPGSATRWPVQSLLPLLHGNAAQATSLSSRHHIIMSRPARCSGSMICRAKQQQSKGAAAGKKSQDDMADVIMIGGEDEEYEDEFEGEFELEDEFEDEDDDGFLEDDDEVDEGIGLLDAGSDEDPGPEVLTGNVTWGDTALSVAKQVLERPENANLALYLFRVLVPNKTIEIRLDRVDDVYGSPDIDDIERFSRALMQGLEAALGAEEAGNISFEVSSPGAERTLIIPRDLLRFKDLPMKVEFMSEVGQLTTLVLMFLDMDEAEDTTTWQLADVKANQNVKGRGLSKKQRAQLYTIRLSELQRVRIYIDF